MDNRPTWEQYFHGIAAAVALRATCPRASVGLVIVSEEHRILSTGYNGAPPGEAGRAPPSRGRASGPPSADR